MDFKNNTIAAVIKYLFITAGILFTWFTQDYLLEQQQYTMWIIMYGMFYFFAILFVWILADEFILKGDTIGEIAKNGIGAAIFSLAIVFAAVSGSFIASTFITDPFAIRHGNYAEEPIDSTLATPTSTTISIESATFDNQGGKEIHWSED